MLHYMKVSIKPSAFQKDWGRFLLFKEKPKLMFRNRTLYFIRAKTINIKDININKQKEKWT